MFNQITLVGRLTRDPEMRHTTSQKSVVNFSIAVDSGFGDKKTTDFFDCTAWEKTAETIAKYLTKGSLTIISGEGHFRKYTANDGTEKKVFEVTVREMRMLGGKNENKPDSAPVGATAGAASGRPAAEAMDYGSDDIPF